MINPPLSTFLEWLNELMRIADGATGNIREAHFYRFLAIVLFSQSTGMMWDLCIAFFSELGFITPLTRHISQLGNKLILFHLTLRVTDTPGTWRSQCDATQLLNGFGS